MYLLAIAWFYVVVLMALAEATAANGSWLGAAVTFVSTACLPLGIALYLFGTPCAASGAAAARRDQPRGRSRRRRPSAR